MVIVETIDMQVATQNYTGYCLHDLMIIPRVYINNKIIIDHDQIASLLIPSLCAFLQV